MKLVLIGVGTSIDRTQLNTMAGSTGHVYLPKSFKELVSLQFIETVADITCEEAAKLVCPCKVLVAAAEKKAADSISALKLTVELLTKELKALQSTTNSQ